VRLHCETQINCVVLYTNTLADLVVPVENSAHKQLILELTHGGTESIHVQPLDVEL